jgi:hypothetical protein
VSQADAVDEEAEAIEAEQAVNAKETDQEKEKQSCATVLVELVDDAGVELFHDADGEAFARFPVIEGDADEVDHREVSRLRARLFRRWLSRQYYMAAGKAPGSQALEDALGVLEGRAIFDGEQHDVHVRVAEVDGRIYIDLCDTHWRVVEVDARGWRVLKESPVVFYRAKAMLPLPVPVRGGSVDELRHLLNIPDESWPLVLAWLIAGLRGRGPYPVLTMYGEQGSAKSTACEMLRMIIDPNTAPLRSEPREPRDLMIAARNGRVITLDNLSYLPNWLSDCLCRLATGGGFSTRSLYTDDEETIFTAQRPCLLNGIEEVVTRGDLLDRGLLVNLPAIPEESRRTEKEVVADFERARPRILGALLTALSTGLKTLPSTRIERLPRMADFALWAVACEPGLALKTGEFMRAYKGNRESANESAIEGSPIGRKLLEFVAEKVEWSGTATELLTELDDRADEKLRHQKYWPKSSRSLSGMVRRLAPNLRAIGIDADCDGHQGRGGQKRKCIRLTRRTEAENCVPTDPIVPNPKSEGKCGDAGKANTLCGDASRGGEDDAGTQPQVDVVPSAVTVGTHGDGGDDAMHGRSDWEVF